MGVFRKDGAWWIDWYEGGRRRRKKTHCTSKKDARKLLTQVKGKTLTRNFHLYDESLTTKDLVSRYHTAAASWMKKLCGWARQADSGMSMQTRASSSPTARL